MQISILATSLGTCHSACESEMLYVPLNVLQFVYRWQALLLLLVYCRQFSSLFIVEPGRIHPLIINTAILVYTATRISSLSNLLLCLCSFKYSQTYCIISSDLFSVPEVAVFTVLPSACNYSDLLTVYSDTA
jgi:hypothetical protein